MKTLRPITGNSALERTLEELRLAIQRISPIAGKGVRLRQSPHGTTHEVTATGGWGSAVAGVEAKRFRVVKVRGDYLACVEHPDYGGPGEPTDPATEIEFHEDPQATSPGVLTTFVAKPWILRASTNHDNDDLIPNATVQLSEITYAVEACQTRHVIVDSTEVLQGVVPAYVEYDYDNSIAGSIITAIKVNTDVIADLNLPWSREPADPFRIQWLDITNDRHWEFSLRVIDACYNSQSYRYVGGLSQEEVA